MTCRYRPSRQTLVPILDGVMCPFAVLFSLRVRPVIPGHLFLQNVESRLASFRCGTHHSIFRPDGARAQSSHTGSVALASPINRKLGSGIRQNLLCGGSQERQGSGIHSSPRNFWNALGALPYLNRARVRARCRSACPESLPRHDTAARGRRGSISINCRPQPPCRLWGSGRGSRE